VLVGAGHRGEQAVGDVEMPVLHLLVQCCEGLQAHQEVQHHPHHGGVVRAVHEGGDAAVLLEGVPAL
jgi:hypothetical protein